MVTILELKPDISSTQENSYTWLHAVFQWFSAFFWQQPKISSNSTMATHALKDFLLYNYAYERVLHSTIYIQTLLYKQKLDIQDIKMYIQSISTVYSYIGNNKSRLPTFKHLKCSWHGISILLHQPERAPPPANS